MKLDRAQLGLHLPWLLVATLVAIMPVGWYMSASVSADRWQGGGSASGLACGIAAGSIVAFEMLLWPRKYFRRLRLIPARHWMAAHIWLGLASLPLAVFHCGFHLGGMLPTLLMWLFIGCLASGLYGLLLQNIIPKLSLRMVPAETIYSQIDHVSQQNVNDIRQAIVAGCGPRPRQDKDGEKIFEIEPALPTRSTVVVGAIREIGLVHGRTIRTSSVITDVRDREILWTAFDNLEPFLLKGSSSGSHLAAEGEAVKWFGDLKKACSENGQSIISTMEQFYHQRQQFDLQRRLHHWLYAWLPLHIGLSVAVTTLLLVHVITALRYW